MSVPHHAYNSREIGVCELFAMSSARESVVRYELDLFAGEGGERHRNRDGWGIMFAEARDAHLFREAEPAADSALARMVVEREIPCRQLIAHVRRASRGRPMLANTHPFSRVRHGRVQHFAHNGTLHGLEDLPEAAALLAERVGDTDSELAFLLLLAELEHEPDFDAVETRFAIFRRFAGRMRGLGPANFLFYDGGTLFVHADRRTFETPTGLSAPREPGLVVRHFAQESDPGDWRSKGARIGSVHPQTILFASVPLNSKGWQPLERGTTLALRDGRILADGLSS